MGIILYESHYSSSGGMLGAHAIASSMEDLHDYAFVRHGMSCHAYLWY